MTRTEIDQWSASKNLHPVFRWLSFHLIFLDFRLTVDTQGIISTDTFRIILNENVLEKKFNIIGKKVMWF